MLAQSCDLPFSGGSVGAVLVLGALSISAGVLILGVQARSGRGVCGLLVVGSLATATLLFGSVDRAAATGTSTTTIVGPSGEDPPAGECVETSVTSSSTMSST